MKKILIHFVLMLCLSAVYGQDYQKIDSLEQVLKSLPELDGTDADSTRMRLYLRIADLFESSIPDSAIWWYSKSIDTNFIPENIKKYTLRAKLNASALRYIGIVENSLGNYSNAILFCEHSLKISEELGDKKRISKCLNILGNATANMCNYPEALSFYTRSLIIAEEIGDKTGITSCLNNLGTVALDCGNYSDALSYFERSLKMAEELKDKTLISIRLTNLGCLAMMQGNTSDAISFFERNMKIVEELGNKQMIAANMNNIGNVVLETGNYTEALLYFERSLKISEEIGDNESTSLYLMGLGSVAYSLRKYSDAISYFQRSLKISEELGNKEGIFKSLDGLGIIAIDQGNYSVAVSLLERSMKIKEELGSKTYMASDYPILAKAYIKTKQLAIVPSLLQKSLSLSLWLLKDNFSIMSEKDKELYLEKTKEVFNEINFFNTNYSGYNDSLPGICFSNELVLKGLLLKSTSGVVNVVYNSSDPEIKKAYFLLKQYRDNLSSLQGTENANRDSLIADLEKKANEQERKLVRMSSEFADIQNLFNYKWEDVRKNLKSNEAAIEFVSFTQGVNRDTTVYAALIITAESKMPVSVKLFEDGELQKILGKSTGAGYNYVKSLYGENNTALYKLVWKPLESALAGINTVYYAPVGVLNKISFAAMSVESGKILSDVYMLHQVSTTGKLINKDEAKELKMTAAVFGGIDYNPDSLKLETWNYLPGTLNEKNSIENQLKKNKITCLSYSGKEAKEETFKALFDSTDAPSILHISTHGFFFPDPEVKQSEKQNESEENEVVFRGSSGFGNWMFVNNKNPMMRSGLVFAGANRVWNEEWGKTDNEGVLTAYEVSNMNMRNTDLVVLSACETGLGDIKGSEGVYGLQRAFKMAGVKYIIMSLWQVPDKETVEFMETFYKKLLKTKDVRKSFNETQKEMRKKYDPYYWAAFILVE